MKNRLILHVAYVATLASVGGCVGTDITQRPSVDTPTYYSGGAPSATALTAMPSWETFYQDAVLKELIAEALNQNRDIGIALSRIDEARAVAGFTRLQQWPQVSASIGDTRSSSSLAGSNAPPAANRQRSVYAGSLDMSFELDLWGRLRSTTAAARLDLLASGYSAQTVRLTVIADVATAYFNLQALKHQLEVTLRTVATREKAAELTKSQVKHGTSSGLDLNRVEANLSSAASTLPDIRRQLAQTENQLQILMGRSPKPDFPQGAISSALPLLPDIPSGLPSELLQRRPDLRQAEASLSASSARLTATKAALFPSISLTGSVGSQSLAFSKLFTGPAGTWTFGLGVLEPIINASRNGYQVDAGKAREQQAILGYQKATEQAFREVSDALIARSRNLETQQALDQQVKFLQEVNNGVQRRYRAGYTSYFEVNDADRDLFNAELQRVQAYRNSALSSVQLFKALGGGWDDKLSGQQ
jgi:outer membrane protein, multidrug efflux system